MDKKDLDYLKELNCHELIELAKVATNDDEVAIYIHFYNIKLAENTKKFLNSEMKKYD